MTLPTIAGVQSRIHTLPDRPQFMIIREMAEVFGIEQRNLARQFQRSRHKFPEGYFFVLSPEEYREKLTKKWQTSQGSRADLEQFAFSEKGALFLLRFVNSEQADAASILLIEAFVGLREAKITALQSLALKDEAAYLGRSPMRAAIKLAAEKGWTFGQLWGAHDWSQPKLGRAVEEMRARGYIAADALFVPAYVLMGRNYERVLLDMHAEDARQMRLGLEV